MIGYRPNILKVLLGKICFFGSQYGVNPLFIGNSITAIQRRRLGVSHSSHKSFTEIRPNFWRLGNA